MSNIEKTMICTFYIIFAFYIIYTMLCALKIAFPHDFPMRSASRPKEDVWLADLPSLWPGRDTVVQPGSAVGPGLQKNGGWIL